MKPDQKPNQVMLEIADFVRQCGRTGTHTGTIVANVRLARQRSGMRTVQGSLTHLMRLGLVVGLPDPGPAPMHRRLRYFAPEFAPADRPPKTPPRADATHLHRRKASTEHGGPIFAPVRPRNARLSPDAPAIVPPGLKVTKCPSGRDDRFSVPPGTKVVGAGFVAEWKHLRRQRKAAP